MKYLQLSATGFDRIELCARKYHYEEVLRLGLTEKPDYLEKGDLMHQILENHYNMVKAGGHQYVDIMKESTEVGRRASIKMDLTPAESEETISQYKQYAMYYKDEPWVPLEVESKFAVIIYQRSDAPNSSCELCRAKSNEQEQLACELHEGLTIIGIGKIDLKAVHKHNGDIFIWDHKTAQQNRKPTKLVNQFAMYALARTQHNVLLNRIGFQKTLPPSERFRRFMMSYPQALLDEWLQDVVYYTGRIEEHQRTGYWPMNWTSCDKFNGCIFKDICATHPMAREGRLRASFVHKPHKLFEEEKPADE